MITKFTNLKTIKYRFYVSNPKKRQKSQQLCYSCMQTTGGSWLSPACSSLRRQQEQQSRVLALAQLPEEQSLGTAWHCPRSWGTPELRAHLSLLPPQEGEQARGLCSENHTALPCFGKPQTHNQRLLCLHCICFTGRSLNGISYDLQKLGVLGT